MCSKYRLLLQLEPVYHFQLLTTKTHNNFAETHLGGGDMSAFFSLLATNARVLSLTSLPVQFP